MKKPDLFETLLHYFRRPLWKVDVMKTELDEADDSLVELQFRLIRKGDNYTAEFPAIKVDGICVFDGGKKWQ